VLGLLAATAWLVLNRPDDPDDPGNGGTASTADLIGDSRTADPCALIDSDALAEYGDAVLDADYGNFNACYVFVTDPSGTEVDVKVGFAQEGDGPPSGQAEMIGQIGVIREPGDGDSCTRNLALPGDERFAFVSASQHDDGVADLCAMADTAASVAVEALNRGPVPRREAPDTESLINVDACGLLDAEALDLFPGVEATRPEARFANWECHWRNTDGATLLIEFDREDQAAAQTGSPVTIGGHQVYIDPEGYGDACQVSVVHREYTSENGDPRVERMIVAILRDDQDAVACDLVAGLAEPAASALPPT